MPELPEVETIIRDLNQKILNKKIRLVEVRLKKVIKNKLIEFKSALEGNSFEKISRRGKLIIIRLKQRNKYLLIHLRMTGQLVYWDKKLIIAGGHSGQENNFNLPNKHTHLVIVFRDNSKLFFNDQRQFGFLQIVDSQELESIKNKFGIEPLSFDFSLRRFLGLIRDKKVNIKTFLLNQKNIAGIGNIYADEILFQAGIKPARNIFSLKPGETKKIFLATRQVLKKAIRYRGTTFNNYVDASGNKGGFAKLLKVYGREGKKCPRCNGIIRKIKLAGRGTSYCPACQR